MRTSKNDCLSLTFNDMIKLAVYFGAKIVNKRGSRRNIHYPASSQSPVMQLHEPHGSRDDVAPFYKKKFYNIFSDEIEREAKSERE